MLGSAAALAFVQAASARAHNVIDERGFVPVGGIDQWVAIQGIPGSPAILYLHGGPAEARHGGEGNTRGGDPGSAQAQPVIRQP